MEWVNSYEYTNCSNIVGFLGLLLARDSIAFGEVQRVGPMKVLEEVTVMSR